MHFQLPVQFITAALQHTLTWFIQTILSATLHLVTSFGAVETILINLLRFLSQLGEGRISLS